MTNQNKKIAIISAEKFANKINEDILLKDAFIKLGFSADIVAWENDNIDWSLYSGAVLRSAWGYHKQIEKFETFLSKLSQNNVVLVNDTNVIKWNIHKDKQFPDLIQEGINVIPTYFIQNNLHNLEGLLQKFAKKFNCSEFVIKPTISGSGDNTFLISLDDKIYKKNQISIKEAENKFNHLLKLQNNLGVMLQPYVKGINDGEYSFVFIDSKLSHVGIRFPAIFHEKKDTLEQDASKLPPELVIFANKCLYAVENISKKLQKEVSVSLPYLRCDIVKNNDQYMLMEAEAAEPDLLIRNISSSEKRQKTVFNLAEVLIRKIYFSKESR